MKEIEAAYESGMQAILCDRDLKASQSPEANMVIIRSFDEVFPGWLQSFYTLN
jgi:hypothetical protein